MANKLKRDYIRRTLKEVTDGTTKTQPPYLMVRAPSTGPYHNMPNIRFFDPIKQLGIKLKCRYENEGHKDIFISVTNDWTDFGRQDPRTIYGLEKNTYLVCRMYCCRVCGRNKQIRSTNETFLRQLPNYPPIDFILYHCSAVETIVYNIIVTSVVNGVAFAKIAKQFRELKKMDFAQHMSQDEKEANLTMDADTYRLG